MYRTIQSASLTVLVMLSCSIPAAAYDVAPLPGDNLLLNPWFRDGAAVPGAAGFTHWDLVGNPTWGGGSDKDSSPGPTGEGAAPSARWARRAGSTPEFYPGVEVVMHQIVAAPSSHKTLRFFMHWVCHRIDKGEVRIYGGSSATGPWTQVWVPFQHQQSTVVVYPSQAEVWQHFTSLPGKFDAWQSPVPRTTTLSQGYSHYKIEFRAQYGQPDASPSGGVGMKFTGAYFATAGGPSSDGAPPQDASAPADGGISTSGDGRARPVDGAATTADSSPPRPAEGGAQVKDASPTGEQTDGCSCAIFLPARPMSNGAWVLITILLCGWALKRRPHRRREEMSPR